MEGYKYVVNDKGIPIPKINDMDEEKIGIIPRSIRHLFDQITSKGTSKKFNVYVSFLQIY